MAEPERHPLRFGSPALQRRGQLEHLHEQALAEEREAAKEKVEKDLADARAKFAKVTAEYEKEARELSTYIRRLEEAISLPGLFRAVEDPKPETVAQGQDHIRTLIQAVSQAMEFLTSDEAEELVSRTLGLTSAEIEAKTTERAVAKMEKESQTRERGLVPETAQRAAITARWHQKCQTCAEDIHPGDKAVRYTAGWCHKVCRYSSIEA